MTPYEKYPLVNKLLMMFGGASPIAFDERQNPDHSFVDEEKEAKLKTLRHWLSNDCTVKPTQAEIKDLLEGLEEEYADLAAFGDEYSFFRGFAVCAELLAEVNAIRETAQLK